MDEANKKIIAFDKIDLNFQTESLGSVYETDADTFIINAGQKKKIQKMRLENNKVNLLYEIDFSTPTYRVYEVKSLY